LPAPVVPEPFIGEDAVIQGSVHFDFDKASLDEVSTKALDDLADKIKNSSAQKSIEIGGYTDSLGPDDYNAKLSKARAQVVADYLKAHGVTAAPLVKGFGSALPVDPAPTKAAHARNRRTEIIAHITTAAPKS